MGKSSKTSLNLSFSYLLDVILHSKSYILPKTPLKSDTSFQSYYLLKGCQNNRKQNDLFALFGSFSKSIFMTHSAWSYHIWIQNGENYLFCLELYVSCMLSTIPDTWWVVFSVMQHRLGLNHPLSLYQELIKIGSPEDSDCYRETVLSYNVKMQYVHYRLKTNYFLFPWKIPAEICRRSMLFEN